MYETLKNATGWNFSCDLPVSCTSIIGIAAKATILPRLLVISGNIVCLLALTRAKTMHRATRLLLFNLVGAVIARELSGIMKAAILLATCEDVSANFCTPINFLKYTGEYTQIVVIVATAVERYYAVRHVETLGKISPRTLAAALAVHYIGAVILFVTFNFYLRSHNPSVYCFKFSWSAADLTSGVMENIVIVLALGSLSAERRLNKKYYEAYLKGEKILSLDQRVEISRNDKVTKLMSIVCWATILKLLGNTAAHIVAHTTCTCASCDAVLISQITDVAELVFSTTLPILMMTKSNDVKAVLRQAFKRRGLPEVEAEPEGEERIKQLEQIWATSAKEKGDC